MLGLKLIQVSKRGYRSHRKHSTLAVRTGDPVTSSPKHSHSDPDLSLPVLTIDHKDQQSLTQCKYKNKKLETQVHVNWEWNEWNTKAKTTKKCLKMCWQPMRKLLSMMRKLQKTEIKLTGFNGRNFHRVKLTQVSLMGFKITMRLPTAGKWGKS